MKVRKHLFVFLSFFLLSSVSAQAQTDWEVLREAAPGVKLLRQEVEWQDISHGVHNKVVILRLVNQSDKTVQVSWRENLYYNEKCYQCESEAAQRSFRLEAGQKIEGELDFDAPQNGLRIFSRSMSGHTETRLTDLQILDFTVRATEE